MYMQMHRAQRLRTVAVQSRRCAPRQRHKTRKNNKQSCTRCVLGCIHTAAMCVLQRFAKSIMRQSAGVMSSSLRGLGPTCMHACLQAQLPDRSDRGGYAMMMVVPPACIT